MTTQANFPDIRPSLLLDFANSGQVDPRVTFTRASTATYYDIDTVAKAEENLLTYSQELDNAAWAKSNGVVTANTTTAPDGTSTADTFTPNAQTAFFRVAHPTTATGPVTVSVFVKANGYSKVAIRENQTSGAAATFDLSTGAVIGVVNTGGITVSNNTITALANSWYRISCTFTGSGSLAAGFLVLDPSYTSGSVTTTWAANGTDGIFIWGAQLEQRSAVTAYTATTTQAITNYVPQLMTASAGRPRIDYNPITRAPLGLLIEESRQNVWLRSEDFANASWTKTASSITANTIVAPDGTLTGDKIVEDTANSSHYISQAITSVVSTTYVTSVYLKAGERSAVRLSRNGGTVASAFDLSAGTVTNAAGSTGTITAVGNGWYRCSISFAGASVTDSVYIELQTSASTSSQTYTGNGYAGVYVWGAQWETGSFATSYIPTVASAVTRSADAASMTGTNFSSWFSNAEGTFYTELAALGAANQFAAITNPSNTTIDIQRNTSGAANFRVRVSGSDQANVSGGSYGAGVFFRAAGAYKVNDFAFSHNGSAVLTDTSGLIPVVSTFNIGDGSGRIAKIAYYPLRITNAQLQAITG